MVLQVRIKVAFLDRPCHMVNHAEEEAAEEDASYIEDKFDAAEYL